MSWKTGTTVGEAREALSDFLSRLGCYEICAKCPAYPDGQGCCFGCEKLTPEGCSQRNLSCLSCTCAVLDRHLIEREQFEAWNDLVYGIPREGYRGVHPRPDEELLEVSDPLKEMNEALEEYSLSCMGTSEPPEEGE